MWNDPSGGISDLVTQIRGGAALSRFTRGEILYFPNSDWGIGDRSISRKDLDSVTILVVDFVLALKILLLLDFGHNIPEMLQLCNC